MASLLAAGQSLLQQILQQIPHVPQHSLPALVVTFIIVCLTTRFLSRDNGNVGKLNTATGAKPAPAVPYWIPYFGHVPEMTFNSDAFLARLQKVYRGGAFTLNLVGGTHTVIFKPGLVSSLINLPSQTAHGHETSKHLLQTNFGYPRSRSDLETFDRMRDDLLLQYKKLLSEPTLNQMLETTVQTLRHNIADFVTFNDSQVDQVVWERAADAVTIEDAKGETAVEVDLFDLVRNFIAMTANTSLFGTDFVENFPSFWEHLWRLDEGFVALAADLPAFLPISKAIQARRGRYEALRCLREFEVALETAREGNNPGPQWSDLENVSPLIQGRVDEVYRKHNVSIKQRAACELGLAWAMNANCNPLVFWMLWRIYSDPVLLLRIREQIDPYIVLEKPAVGFGAAFDAALRLEKIDLEGLQNNSSLLKAAYIETLRVDSNAWSFKFIREDTVISTEDDPAVKLLLPAGTYAHGAHELHHMNSDAFEDPADWRVDRHAEWAATNGKSETDSVVISGVIRPYGKCSSSP